MNNQIKYISKIKEWQKLNPNKVKIYNKNYRLNNKDKLKERKDKWRKANLQKVNQRNREWRYKNKLSVIESSRKYSLNNPLQIRYHRYKYSAKVRGHKFNLSKEEFMRLLNEKSICKYCGVGGKLGLDRVNNSIGYLLDNVVPCCRTCNTLKKTMSKDKYINICISVAKRYM